MSSANECGWQSFIFGTVPRELISRTAISRWPRDVIKRHVKSDDQGRILSEHSYIILRYWRWCRLVGNNFPKLQCCYVLPHHCRVSITRSYCYLSIVFFKENIGLRFLILKKHADNEVVVGKIQACFHTIYYIYTYLYVKISLIIKKKVMIKNNALREVQSITLSHWTNIILYTWYFKTRLHCSSYTLI